MATPSKVNQTAPEQKRRIIVYGRMPQERKPDSGLFSVNFKEDSFEVDIDERYLYFNIGARTTQSHSLPLYYIDKTYFRRKQLVESMAISDNASLVEVFMQYARLPLIDPPQLQKMRDKVHDAAEEAKTRLVTGRDRQALYDMFRYEICDSPVILLKPDWEKGVLRLKARAPQPPSPTQAVMNRTAKGRVAFFRDYIDALCSDACRYLLAGFSKLTSLESMEITLVRMEAEQIKGLQLVVEEPKPAWEFKTSKNASQQSKNVFEESKLRRGERRLQKAEEAEARKQRKFVQATTYKAECDELFDGTLPYESVLLSTRIPRAGFMEMQRSRNAYSAQNALKAFDLRLDYDEEAMAVNQVGAYF